MTSECQIYHSFNNLANLKEIAALERASFTNPWVSESLSTEIANPLNLTSVIILKSANRSELIGYGLTRIISPEAELLRLAVVPERRGMGVAIKMLEQILQKIRIIQVETVYLEVSEKNLPAIALYQKAGFLNNGYRSNYYDSGTTKALIFKLSL